MRKNIYREFLRNREECKVFFLSRRYQGFLNIRLTFRTTAFDAAYIHDAGWIAIPPAIILISDTFAWVPCVDFLT